MGEVGGSGGWEHTAKTERECTVLQCWGFPVGILSVTLRRVVLQASTGNTAGTKSHSLGKAVGQTLEIQVAVDRGKHAGHGESLGACNTAPLPRHVP